MLSLTWRRRLRVVLAMCLLLGIAILLERSRIDNGCQVEPATPEELGRLNRPYASISFYGRPLKTACFVVVYLFLPDPALEQARHVDWYDASILILRLGDTGRVDTSVYQIIRYQTFGECREAVIAANQFLLDLSQAGFETFPVNFYHPDRYCWRGNSP